MALALGFSSGSSFEFWGDWEGEEGEGGEREERNKEVSERGNGGGMKLRREGMGREKRD